MNLRQLIQQAAADISEGYAQACALALWVAMNRFSGQQVTASLIGEKGGLGWDDATIFEMVRQTPQLGIRIEQQQRVRYAREVLRLSLTPMNNAAYWAYLGIPEPDPIPF